MNPLIGVAASVLPEILKYIEAARSDHDRENLVSAISDAVINTAKAKEPEAIRQAMAQNPQLASDLKVKLAQISAKAEKSLLDGQDQARQTALDAMGSKQSQDITRLTQELAAHRKATSDELSKMQSDLDNTKNARETLSRLTSAKSPVAWAAPVISVLIVAGFFVTLGVLLSNRFDLPTDSSKIQIINIVIGALTAAFATVISFWMGSSQGSKNKDIANFTARQTEAEAAKAQAKAFSDAKQGTVPAAPTQTPSTAPVAPQPKKFANESDFARCVGYILTDEGGFVDNPDDPGRATNMGITQATLSEWRGDPATVADVKSLTKAEAEQIYRVKYWNALNCENLPAGVNLSVFDFGVNAGISRSAKLLQQVVGVAQDGIIGQITLAAVDKVDPQHIVTRFGELRMEYYRGLKTWSDFGTGWSERVARTQSEARAMMA